MTPPTPIRQDHDVALLIGLYTDLPPCAREVAESYTPAAVRQLEARWRQELDRGVRR